MIRGLAIKDYGSFKKFQWKKDNDQFVFKKLNIIYGHNYSGKTTLSRIFNTLENKAPHIDYPRGDFELYFDNNVTYRSDQLSNFSTDYEVRVFNSDFIKNNLGWFFNNDGTIEPFTVLGSSNVEIQNEINILQEKLGKNEKNKETGFYKNLLDSEVNKKSQMKNRNTLEKELNNLLTREAASIRGNQKIYDRDPYTRTQLERDIDKVGNYKELSCDEYDKAVKELDETELPTMRYNTLDIEKIGEVISDSRDLLRSSVAISNPIKELLENELLRSWVNKGVGLHKDDNSNCKFCGQPISRKTWKLLTNHFNDESKELEEKVCSKIEELNKIEIEIQDHFSYQKSDFYIEYHEEYLRVYEKWNIEKNQISKKIKLILDKLDLKYKNITEIIHYDIDVSIMDQAKIISDKIRDLISLNNKKSNSLIIDKKKLHNKILMSDLLKFLRVENIASKKEAIEQAIITENLAIDNYEELKKPANKKSIGN